MFGIQIRLIPHLISFDESLVRSCYFPDIKGVGIVFIDRGFVFAIVPDRFVQTFEQLALLTGAIKGRIAGSF